MPTLTAADRARIAYSSDPNDHLRLVWSIAKRFQGRGLDLEDLVGHGNIGLVEASRRYDPTRRIRFNTYASYWIKQAIRRGLIEDRWPIRVPEYAMTALWRADHGEAQPGLEEAIRLARAATAGCTGPSWLDELAIDRGEVPDPDLGPLRARLLALVGRLTPRQREVIERRFGLGGRSVQTYRQIGALVGLGRERIRQIEVEAIGELKALAAKTDGRTAASIRERSKA